MVTVENAAAQSRPMIMHCPYPVYWRPEWFNAARQAQKPRRAKRALPHRVMKAHQKSVPATRIVKASTPKVWETTTGRKNGTTPRRKVAPAAESIGKSVHSISKRLEANRERPKERTVTRTKQAILPGHGLAGYSSKAFIHI